MENLRSKIIKLAHAQPELRGKLLPLLKEASDGMVDQLGKLIETNLKRDVPALDVDQLPALGGASAGQLYFRVLFAEKPKRVDVILLPDSVMFAGGNMRMGLPDKNLEYGNSNPRQVYQKIVAILQEWRRDWTGI
jgi:hypothetical protein